MTDTYELEKHIRKKGMTKHEVAQYLNLSVQGFLLKLTNKNEFKASEIQKLKELLDCDYDIFFGNDVELNSH